MDDNHGRGAGLLDPPDKTQTQASSTPPGRQLKPGKTIAKFFSKKTGMKVVAGAKWVGLGSLILGTGSFIYRKTKGMSWKGAFLSAFSFGPLDPQ